MATDEVLISRTVRDYFEGWHDAGVARMDRALHHIHLIRTGGGWKILDALWLPR